MNNPLTSQKGLHVEEPRWMVSGVRGFPSFDSIDKKVAVYSQSGEDMGGRPTQTSLVQTQGQLMSQGLAGFKSSRTWGGPKLGVSYTET